MTNPDVIRVPILTRVEGEGALTISLRAGRLADVPDNPAIQSVLRNLTFSNVSTNPSTLQRTIEFRGRSAAQDSNIVTKPMNVVAVPNLAAATASSLPSSEFDWSSSTSQRSAHSAFVG